MNRRQRDMIRPLPRRRGSFIDVSLMDDEVRYLFAKVRVGDFDDTGFDAAAVRTEILRAFELVEPKVRSA